MPVEVKHDNFLVYEDVNELESSRIPLLGKEGWMRDQENIAKQP